MVECLLPPPKAKALGRTRLNMKFLAGKDINMYFVYVLRCKNLKRNKIEFYVGQSDNLIERLKDHKSKSVETTKAFDRIELVYYEASLNKKDAIKRELQLKTGFGRGYLQRRIQNYLREFKQL